jgi:alpha-tubulin suppressor-like RCC1 family protein
MQVAAGGQHTCAIEQLGGVQCWGANSNGQLGNNSTTDQFAPVDVAGLDYSSTSTRAIAAGNFHSCALTNLGAVKCWGANNLGQLGNGTFSQSLVPFNVTGLASGVAAIAAGGDTTCVLMMTGAIKCWGGNANGELGLGIVGGSRNVPTDVPQFAGGGAIGVSVGNGSVFALLPDSTVFSWGLATAGRLGNNSTVGNFSLPIQTLGIGGTGILRLLASDTFPNAFTLQSRFGVGRNEVVTSNPVNVSGITSPATVTVTGGLISIDGGAYFAGPGSVANGGVVRVRVTASMNYDTLSVATLNIGGQTASFQVRTRKNPSDASVVPAIALGENFTLILGSNGLVYGAGYNGTRQMGNGSTLNATAHGPVAGLTNIRRIAAGGNHALALRSDGTVVAWGYNAAGQLGGAGAANSSGYPTQVAVLTGVSEIAAGQNHSLALKSDGTLWAWGLNAEGQLGTGNTVSTATPVQVLTGVQSIAAGARHTLAIKTNGTLWSWGANESGQLGSGNTTPRSTPSQVGTATNWLAISAGSAHALGLRTDGTLYSWGANNKGQLGDGTVVGKTLPTLIAGLTAIAAIAAGSEHSLALRVGGVGYSWGSNDASQLGDGLTAQRSSPFQIPNQGNLIAVAAGGAHSAALTKFGEVLVWGRNDDGQLGNRGTGTKGGPETIDTGKSRTELPTVHATSVSPPVGTSNGISSSSGTSVLVIKSLGYLSNDFGSSNLGTSTRSTYIYANQSIAPNASFIGNLSVSVSGTDFSLANSSCSQTLLPGNTCDFDIDFVPAAAGDRQGTLVVDSDITGSPQSFTLYGTGVGPMTPAMTLGVTQMPFAARTVGAAEVETFLIGNSGTATLNVTSAASNLADFGTTHNCASVAPATTCTVTVTFTPSASGTRIATLTITSNAGTQTVALSGAGVNAVVDIDPAPFSFAPLNSVTVATLQTSNSVTISGIDTVAPVSVTNGEFSVGCTATFITGTGTISNGQTICVRHVSAATISTAYTTTLKIGGVSGQFTTTTANTPLYALSVVKAGAGSGSVVAVSPSIPSLNCGLTCNANYNAGTVIELVATPNAGSAIAAWTGCNAANGVRCIVTLNASRSVTATFATGAATLPGAPTIGTAVAGNAQAMIAFSAPASNGGSPITYYTATCNPGAVRAVGTSGGAATAITVTGLNNATIYACSVTASNAAGTSAPSATVLVTPQSSAPFALIGVQSRKTHAGAGEFDLLIDAVPPITGNITVEPRAATGAHRIVFQFSGPVTQAGTASAVDINSAAIGNIGGTRTQGNEVIVTLTNIPDASRVKVALANVNGAGLGMQASIGFLVGDTNQTGRVNAADIGGTKANLSQAANGSNFRLDANGDGVIDAKDVSMVKVRAGMTLP